MLNEEKAQRTCELVKFQSPLDLHTLASVAAETGDFVAIRWMKRDIEAWREKH